MRSFTYHEGNLANDRLEDPAVELKAVYWMAEQEAGRAALVQQRIGNFGSGCFKYIAQVGEDHACFS